jgi:signal peptidase II
MPDAPRRRSASTRPKFPLLVLLPILIVVLDQMLKVVMVRWIGPESTPHRWELAGSFLAFEYLENRGAAFGIFPNQTEMLTVLSTGIAAAGIALMWRESRAHPFMAIAIGMVVGGAIGNIIDRIRLGYVVDFIAVGVWPKFNLADATITMGVVLLLWSTVQEERRDTRSNQGINTHE